MDVLPQFSEVRSSFEASTLDEATKTLAKEDVNCIFIDPLAFGLDETSTFIFALRDSHPGIVFALYISKRAVQAVQAEFYRGQRRRFSHYYSLDKDTPVSGFSDAVEGTLEFCQFDLQWYRSSLRIGLVQDVVNDLSQRPLQGEEAKLLERLRELIDGLSLGSPSQRAPARPKSVFLSHRFCEEEYIDGLSRLLRESGFEVITGRSAASSISKAILDRIMRCKYFVSIMTKQQEKADGTFTTSTWLHQELGAAIAYNKLLVLLVEEGVTD